MKALVAVGMLGATATAGNVKLTPTAVAVSSTVDSAAFLPDHLIDGDKTTAWNSAAGDTNAWIAFRVPATAHVATIKLTVGFTARDWFKQNLRIQQVTVRHDGLEIRAKLDPDSTELQTIAIDGGGGDYTISVDRTVEGTNKAWNEVIVSELEVWGTGPDAKKPHVIIGSLDVDCVRLLWPTAKGGRIGSFEAVRTVAYAAPFCIVDHGTGKDGEQHTTSVGLIQNNTVSDRLDRTLTSSDQHVKIDAFKLGDEDAVSITEENAHYGEMTSNVKAKHTLYRIGTGKLLAVTSYETHSQNVEQSGEGHDCKLVIGAAGKPPALVLECEDSSSSADGTPAPVKKSATKLHWTGKRYE